MSGWSGGITELFGPSPTPAGSSSGAICQVPVGVGVEPQPLGQILCLPLGQSDPETQAIGEPNPWLLRWVGVGGCTGWDGG